MVSDRFQELHKAVDYLTHVDSGFVVIEVNDRISQNKCVSFLETELTSKEIVSIDLEDKPENLRPDNFIKSVVEENPDVPIFCVLNMSSLAKGVREDEIALLRNFNMGREKLADLDRLLVFFFPSYFVDLILRYALDFYDFSPLRIKIPNPERQFMDRRDYEPEFADEKYVLNRVEFLKSRLDGDLDDEERFKVLMDLGDCYGKLYRWDEAIEVFEGAVELAEEMGVPDNKAAAYMRQGRVAYVSGRYDTAKSIFESGIELVTAFDDKYVLGSFLVHLARVLQYKGELDKALEVLDDCLRISTELGETKESAVVLGDMANILKRKGLFDEALELSKKEIATYDALNDSKASAFAARDLAGIYLLKGQIDIAIEVLKGILENDEVISDARDHAIVLGDLAKAFMEKGQRNEALSLYEKVLKELERIGDSRSRAITLYDMGQAELLSDDINSALPHLIESHAISRELQDSFGMWCTGSLIGQIVFALGERDAGLHMIRESFLGFEEMGFAHDALNAKQILDGLEAYAATNPLPEENNTEDSE